MARRYTAIVSTEQARQIVDMLTPHGLAAEVWPADTASTSTIALSESATQYLGLLDEHHDGHIDDDGVMWIGGTDYPLDVVNV